MAKTDYKTIDAYHKAHTAEIQERMQTIRKIIHQVAPKTDEVISYQIPAFKIEKAWLIYYSASAKHISLLSPWSQALLNEFKDELKSLKVSRAAIQFPSDKPLPISLFKKIVKFRAKEVGVK